MSDVPPVKYARNRRGEHIAYMDFGEGSTVQLRLREWGAPIEGTWEHPAHVRYWRYQESMSRILTFDPRGIGSSDPAPPSDLGSVTAWVDDSLAVLDDAGVNRCVVSGEGYSAHVAVALAVERPDLVEALVLANTFVSLSWSPERPYGVRAEDLEAIVEQVRQRWGTGRIIYGSAPALGSDPGFLDFCARFERQAAGPGVAEAFTRAYWNSDVAEALARVSVRTLVMHTADFPHVPVEASRAVADAIPGAVWLEVSTPSFYWFDDPDQQRVYQEFMFGPGRAEASERELLTVLFTDIVGSTDRASELGDQRWTGVLDGVDAFVSRTVGRFSGRMVKQTGDGHVATFTVPSRAVQAALAVRHGMPTLGVEMRVGLHTGEVEVRAGGDLGGIAVHAAARIMAAAGPGEILVSAAVPTLVAGSGFAFNDRGAHHLKGVPGEWQLFEVVG